MKTVESEQVALGLLQTQGMRHHRNGDFAAAAATFKQLLSIDSKRSDIAFMAGNAYRSANQFDHAAEHYKMAIALKPDFFAALCNLGLALRELGEIDAGVGILRRAVALEPASVEARVNLTLLLAENVAYDDAISQMQKAIILKPDQPQLYRLLAEFYLKQERFSKAAAALTAALKIEPHAAETLNGLGNCAMLCDDLDGAKKWYLQALRERPDYADAYYNLGNVMRRWNWLDEAVTCFTHAASFAPGNATVLVNIGETLQLLGETAASVRMFEDAAAADSTCQLAHHNLLVSMNYSAAYDAQALYRAHKAWGREGDAASGSAVVFKNSKESHRRLKVGYLSPDFCNHPASAFLAPLLKHHDRAACEIYAYATVEHADEHTGKFRALADHWADISMLHDFDAAAMIRSDAIDILYDTAGHLQGSRLGIFALRAAPIQVSGIGYPSTTGLVAMDYRLSDAWLDPGGEPVNYTEKLLRLPGGFCCYQMPPLEGGVSPLPALRNGYITFGSLHTTARLNEQVIQRWSKLLQKIPAARLIISRTTLMPSVIARLKRWFLENQIELTRIDFLQTMPQEGHLARYKQIDIALDTLPWSGHTTACESLFMGVPVLTLLGDRAAGRMVGSVLRMAGLPDWIAATEEEFVTIAEKKANSVAELAALRTSLGSGLAATPLCDGKTYTAQVENAYRAIWTAWCALH